MCNVALYATDNWFQIVSTHKNSMNAWIQRSNIELQQSIDHRTLLDIQRIQSMSLRMMFLNQISGDRTWFPQNESIIVDGWHTMLWIHFDVIVFQLLFLPYIHIANLLNGNEWINWNLIWCDNTEAIR